MKIVAISDTHNKHRELTIPDGDILIHAGDFSIRGLLADLVDFNQWLGTLPHKHKIVIPGNHDFLCENVPGMAIRGFTNARLLIDDFIELGGVRIYGSPWVPEYGRWAYMRPRQEMYRFWERIPEGLDILITHGPPKNILDMTRKGEYVGCESLAEHVVRAKPKNHLFGHIHEGYGVWSNGSTMFYNVSTCDREYNPVNSPRVLELT